MQKFLLKSKKIKEKNRQKESPSVCLLENSPVSRHLTIVFFFFFSPLNPPPHFFLTCCLAMIFSSLVSSAFSGATEPIESHSGRGGASEGKKKREIVYPRVSSADSVLVFETIPRLLWLRLRWAKCVCWLICPPPAVSGTCTEKKKKSSNIIQPTVSRHTHT